MEEIPTRYSQGVKTARNFTGNFRKSDNFDKSLNQHKGFNQHKTHLKAFTQPIQLSKLQACPIFSYSKLCKEGIRRKRVRQKRDGKNKHGYHFWFQWCSADITSKRRQCQDLHLSHASVQVAFGPLGTFPQVGLPLWWPLWGWVGAPGMSVEHCLQYAGESEDKNLGSSFIFRCWDWWDFEGLDWELWLVQYYLHHIMKECCAQPQFEFLDKVNWFRHSESV